MKEEINIERRFIWKQSRSRIQSKQNKAKYK